MPVKKNIVNLPMERLLAPIGVVDAALRTVEVVWLSGERIKRYDWMRDQYYYLEFSPDPASVRMGRLQSGAAPVLDTHGTWGLSSQIGVVEKAAYDAGRGTARLRFSARAEVQPIFQDVTDKIIRNVSAGINVYRFELMPPDAQSEGLPIRRAVDWEPAEISLVPIGADAGAGTLADQSQRTHPCEVIDLSADPAHQPQEHIMTPAEQAAQAAAATAETARLAEQQRLQQTETQRASLEAATLAALSGERKRVLEINELCAMHKIDERFRAESIEKGTAVDEVRKQLLTKLAARSASIPVASGVDLDAAGGKVKLDTRAIYEKRRLAATKLAAH